MQANSQTQLSTHTGDLSDVGPAIREIENFVASFEWDAHPRLREPLIRILLDTIGVMIAGTQTEELRALVSAWEPAPDPARVFGTGRRSTSLDVARIASITVGTHRVAASLDRTFWSTRLAAMFYIPYVVGAALTTGGCWPAAFDRPHRESAAIQRLAEITEVLGTDEFDRRFPEERAARLTLRLDDGSEVKVEMPNPVGDAAYHPFGMEEICEKLKGLLAPGTIAPRELETLVRELIEADSINGPLEKVP